jgi:hypothetical protein
MSAIGFFLKNNIGEKNQIIFYCHLTKSFFQITFNDVGHAVPAVLMGDPFFYIASIGPIAENNVLR